VLKLNTFTGMALVSTLVLILWHQKLKKVLLQAESFVGINVLKLIFSTGIGLVLQHVLHLYHLKHKVPSNKESSVGTLVSLLSTFIGMAHVSTHAPHH